MRTKEEGVRASGWRVGRTVARTVSFWQDHWIGGQVLTATFPMLFSFCQRASISVQTAQADSHCDLHLHPRLSTAASAELRVFLPALDHALPTPGVPDRRGIGLRLQPFSSSALYGWHMESTPLNPFTDYIWTNVVVPRCKHFL
uniref:Uncharacterized protein n=1 Tax=Setaria italica TaxID=4555 RepID=K4A128_SETIT